MAEGDHFADRAAFIAALDDDDEERRRALAHARGCPECSRALERGSKVVRLLDAMPAPQAPSERALERAAAEILRGLLEAPPRWSPKIGGLLALAALAAFGFALGFAKQRANEAEVYQQALVVALAAGLVAFFAPRRSGAALAVAVVASAAFAAVVGEAPGFEAGVGVKCMLEELLGAVAPLATAFLLAKKQMIPRSAAAFAAAAAGGALAAQAGLNATCPAHDARPHLLVFHLGGVLLAALLGAAAAGRKKTTRAAA